MHVECRQKSSCTNWLRRTKPQSGRVLLDDVSGIARSGEILAIMGSSGVGKTTLLKVLSGQDDSRTTLTTGDISLNNCLTTRSQRSNGSIIGYVEQRELFVETMTSEEHLIFQAMLSMEQSISDEDRRIRVDQIIILFSLEQTAKTVINQLSGGERKRLTLATVLLTDPPVILIDEPTSGLDTYLAMRLMKVIRKLAVEQHRCVIVVLHQPTSEMFALVDSLCLLVHGGRQAYFGDKDEATRFFADECGLQASSLDHYIEQLAETPDAGKETVHRGNMVANQFIKSTIGERLEEDISRLSEQGSDKLKIEEMDEWRSGFSRQLKWLLWRTWILRRNAPMFTIKFFVRIIISSIIYGLVFFQLRPTKDGYERNLTAASFWMGVLVLDTNMSLVMVSILSERPRVSREYKRRVYSLIAYYVSRWLTDACIVVLSTCLSIPIFSLLVGMADPGLLLGIMLLEVLAAGALCSFLAALLTKPQIGNLVLLPVQMAFIQVSGYFINLNCIPIFIDWFKYLSYFYYSLNLILIIQWHNVPCSSFVRDFSLSNPNNNGTVCVRRGDDVLKNYGVDINNFILDISMLIIMFVTLHVAAFVITVIRIRRTL